MAVSLERYLLLVAEGQVQSRVTFISWAGEMLQSITGRFSVAIAKWEVTREWFTVDNVSLHLVTFNIKNYLKFL